MDSRIIPLIVHEQGVLGFDTGLDPAGFAQAKLAQFITERGYLVTPGDSGTESGGVETWQAGGVIEGDAPSGKGKTMVVWGPAFEGERLDRIVGDDARKDEALAAVITWIRSRLVLEGRDCFPHPWPGAVLYGKGGRFLFPPDRLIRRSVEAEGPDAWLNGAERWVHPDLSGGEAAAFTAGALLYRIFCGKAPFSRDDVDIVREDIREGVFIPSRLMAPGLDEDLAALIDKAMAPVPKNRGEKTRPGLDRILLLLESGGRRRKGINDYFHPLEAGELARLNAEKEQFRKQKELSVKTRRFVIRNSLILAGALLAIAAAGLIAGSIIKGKAALPTTEGMEPGEVVATYYSAFETLDHTLMEACVVNKAGKSDIDMVTNFFVINRVRQAYEMAAPPQISARDWIEGGASPTTAFVFGVSDFAMDIRAGSAEETLARVSYILWMPASYAPQEEMPEGEEPSAFTGGADREPPPALPQGFAYTDELRLILRKGAWRIAEISRTPR